jgi:hypothetical protein
MSPTQAADVNDLIESFAINTHMQQGWQYDDTAKTIAALKKLGILHIRESFTGLGHPGMERAAREGIRFTFTIGGGWGLPGVVEYLEAWQKKYPRSIVAIEGPNEVNNWPVSFEGKTGIPGAQAFQRALYAAVRKSAILKNVPVVGLTSWPVFQNDSDIGNIHSYDRGGDFPSRSIKAGLADERSANPGKPIWMTEAGNHTKLGNSDYMEGVSEAVQAKMIPSLYLSAFEQGVSKTFLYQLANQFTDPAHQESYFGLVDQQWKEKPAFSSLKNMIDVLTRESGRGARAPGGSLEYELRDLPPTAHQKLFQTGGGDWILAVWNEPDIWDEQNNTEIDNPTAKVTLKLGRASPKISLFDPLVGSAATGGAEGADAISFALDDHPVFLKIAGGQRS